MSKGEDNFGFFVLIIGCIVYWQIDWFIGFNEVSYLQNRDGFVYKVNSDSKFTGKYVGYYENGTDKNRQLKEEIIYVDGVKDGGYTYWYQNGKKDGLWTFWDKEGNVTKTETYKKGKLIK